MKKKETNNIYIDSLCLLFILNTAVQTRLHDM